MGIRHPLFGVVPFAPLLLFLLFLSLVNPACAQTGKPKAPVGNAVSSVTATSLPSPPSPELVLEDLRLLAIGLDQGRAVFQFPDKTLLQVRTGDRLTGTHAVLTQVLADKVVLEEMLLAKQSREIVLMEKSKGGAAGKVQRFSTASPVNTMRRPPMVVQSSAPLSAPAPARGAAAILDGKE